MIIRLPYKKISSSLPMASCWYCEAPTNSALYGTEEDYFEIWCCAECYKKHGRIYKRLSAKQKAKKNHKRYVKNGQNEVLQPDQNSPTLEVNQ